MITAVEMSGADCVALLRLTVVLQTNTGSALWTWQGRRSIFICDDGGLSRNREPSCFICTSAIFIYFHSQSGVLTFVA